MMALELNNQGIMCVYFGETSGTFCHHLRTDPLNRNDDGYSVYIILTFVMEVAMITCEGSRTPSETQGFDNPILKCVKVW